MSPQFAMLIATAVLAVVAVSAAVIACRAVRELKSHSVPEPAEMDVPPAQTAVALVESAPPPEPEVRVVEGRVIVQPTQDQVVAASMTRPSVRVGIVFSGLIHALRPESRDRIGALMRREYRDRRRSRQRAARAAARSTNTPPTGGQGWVGS